MKTYIAKEWQDILQQQGLNSFDDIWNCEQNKNFETQWVEEPNQRRGGWSGVVRIVLQDAAGKKRVVFLKRQANHMCPSLLHPIKGRPTFKREFCNINRFKKRGIPTVTPIYYSQRGKEAILMTEELTGYQPLKEWFAQWEEKGLPERPLRNRIINEVAKVIGKIHHHNYKHCCLVFKHIFLSLENNEVKVSIIDLEKLRYWFSQTKCRTTDLEDLIRKRVKRISTADQWRFMKTYFGKDASKKEIKAIWRKVSAKLSEYNAREYEH